MTFGAHEIPVLIELGPMQNIVVADFFIGIVMEPALSALFLRPGIPGNRQSLHASVRKFDQVLLQRIDAERVLHLENCELSIGSVRFDQILSVPAEKTRTDTVIIEDRVVEVAEN